MLQKYVLMWTNKFSGEQGYVKTVHNSKGYFENTFDITKAKRYTSKRTADKDLQFMVAIHETDNNAFELVAI